MSKRYYDPTDKRNKWRWRVQWWLNKLSFTCNAHLVSWALGSRPLVDLSGNQDDARQGSMCRRDASENGRCYCGKLGAHPTPLTPGGQSS